MWLSCMYKASDTQAVGPEFDPSWLRPGFARVIVFRFVVI